ncbi:SDR family NAD(P)-dependent oxidoreductase [Kribbella antibiotica]|uniref:SDR family NAD(P)-dependent oxidoreductase n=1 Tax=Kribbella antibiotica TaxID=190195 RepID=UPI00192DE21A|nr:SDR family NAD(P)-dependent oxidoreductase [Kribbella antibiotica]
MAMVWLVTGADSALGRSIVAAAAAAGAVVVAAARHPESVYDLVGAFPQQVEALAFTPERSDETIAGILGYHRRLDVLVNTTEDRAIEDAVLTFFSLQRSGAIVRPDAAAEPWETADAIVAAHTEAGSRPKGLQPLGSRTVHVRSRARTPHGLRAAGQA